MKSAGPTENLVFRQIFGSPLLRSIFQNEFASDSIIPGQSNFGANNEFTGLKEKKSIICVPNTYNYLKATQYYMCLTK